MGGGGHEKKGDDHHAKHDGHGDHGHGHGHGHGHDDHHEAKRLPYNGQPPPFEHIPQPQIGSTEHAEKIQVFDGAMPQPRSLLERFSKVLRLDIFMDEKLPSTGISHGNSHQYISWMEWMFAPMAPLRPRDYVDAYSRPNPCPEEYWQLPWRWPRTKYVNPKIPPPVDGKYNDYYHYLAFKQWLARERDVYVAHANLVHEALARCALREGQYNAAKNCKHLANKSFAMSRMEEMNQALLYMAITGDVAIRETPYPPNFLDEKRKVYDDWLYRTRMRKPGDVA